MELTEFVSYGGTLRTPPRYASQSVSTKGSFNELVANVCDDINVWHQQHSGKEKEALGLPAPIQKQCVELFMMGKTDCVITQGDIIWTLSQLPFETKVQLPKRIQRALVIEAVDWLASASTYVFDLLPNFLKEGISTSEDRHEDNIEHQFIEGVMLFNEMSGEQICLSSLMHDESDVDQATSPDDVVSGETSSYELSFSSFSPEIATKILQYLDATDQPNFALTSRFYLEVQQGYYSRKLNYDNKDVKKLLEKGVQPHTLYHTRPEYRQRQFVLLDKAGKKYFSDLGIGGPKSNQAFVSGAYSLQDLVRNRDNVYRYIKEELSQITQPVFDTLPQHIQKLINRLNEDFAKISFDPKTGKMQGPKPDETYCDAGVVKYLVDRSLTWEQMLNLTPDGLRVLQYSRIPTVYIDPCLLPIERAITLTYFEQLLLTVQMNEERVVGGLTTVDALLDLGPMGFIQQFADDTVDYNLDGVKKYAELGLLTEAHGAALTPDGVAALNTPAIQECIDGGFITVEQALNLTTAGRASFCNEAIFSNIKTGRIFIDSVLNKQFTMTTCSSLLRYPWIPAKTKGQGC